MLARQPCAERFRTPCATALMPSVAKSCSPVQIPGMVWPNVPDDELLNVFVVTRNARAITVSATPVLSSGKVATRSEPPPWMPNRSARMLSENATAFAGTSTSFSMPCPLSVGTYVTLTFRAYDCGLKRLNCVAQRVLNAPGVLPATGMTYVSLICAAATIGKRTRTRKMYLEAFTTKPFRVPAVVATAAFAGAFPSGGQAILPVGTDKIVCPPPNVSRSARSHVSRGRQKSGADERFFDRRPAASPATARASRRRAELQKERETCPLETSSPGR